MSYSCACSSVDRASVFGTEGRGFKSLQARMRAHSSMVEQLPLKESVEGSSPPVLTRVYELVYLHSQM